MELSKRKHIRLKNDDSYFLTICTDQRRQILSRLEAGRAGSSRPTQRLPRIVAALKRFTNRDTGQTLWRSGYHEHVIRDDNDLLEHWSYIDENPARGAEDEYFTPALGGETQ